MRDWHQGSSLRPRRPLTPQERIERAKATIDQGGSAEHAAAHALIAIAELLAGWPL